MASSKYMISEDAGIPKWKLALALGGTAVLATGLYYTFCSKNKGDKKSSDIDSNLKSKNSSKTSNGTAAVVDDTPLGKAKQLKADGNNHFRKGDYDQAIKYYDEAIKACPKEAKQEMSTFYQNKAAAYEHKKDFESVLRDCSSALELNPHYVKALQRRARAAELLKNLDLALEDYTAICITETFGNPETLNVVDRLLKTVGMEHAKELFDQPRKQEPSRLAVRSYLNGFCCDPVTNSLHSEKEGDGDEAEDIPEKHVVPDGYLHARQLLRDEKYSEVAQCCSNELANPLSPYTAHALLLRGAMNCIKLDKEEAKKDLNTLADMEEAPLKFRAAALVKLGALEAAYSNNTEAMVIYNKAFNLDPDNADVYHQRGQMQLLSNNIEAAVENFNKVVELEPNFAIGYIQKLHTDFRYASFKGDSATAGKVMKQFEEARKKFPKCIEVYLLTAQIMMDTEQYSAADEQFTQLLSVEPQCPAGLVYRGMLMVQWKSDIEGAKALIKQALDIDPQCEVALENMATISVQTGELEDGVRLFDRVIPLSRSLNEMAHYCSLRDAAVAQIKVVQRLNISLPKFAQ